ncbi:TPM domain-containing protein [Bacillus sp. MM2020_4]|uniref:TPM domain-containing protein n=2 Tax=Bacillaceae TaxID=186817 RepID=UPI001407D0DC|nr:TPM domain-containing protein [Bacillus sp. MM2020_4]NHC20369.1 TPM domain-containing protein [Bacillus sp. MM2020_4]
MKVQRVFSFILVFFTFFLGAATALAEDIRIPAPVGDIYVQDFAGVLTETEKADLRNLGRSIEDQTTAQVAVLTVDTIGDRAIEEFANEAFRQYGIGSKKENNGVLLVLAMKERVARIEVGYGLEGRIPDGKAGRILDEYAIPYLKNQQPNSAVVETYKALAQEVFAEYGIEGGAQTEPNQSPAVSKDEGGGIPIPSWLIILLVVVVVFLDFRFFGGTLTYLLLSIITRGGGRGGGGSRGGGGGSSGGGGASRGW